MHEFNAMGSKGRCNCFDVDEIVKNDAILKGLSAMNGGGTGPNVG
jgi:hypothetical protein